MTLDDETASLIEEADGWEVAGNRYATGLIRRLTDALKAGYACRDAEVEELRAQLDAAQAHAKAAAQVILAILDESPTERETPADEPIAKRLTHTYMGDCPDDVNGWESRDPECPACRALMGCGSR